MRHGTIRVKSSVLEIDLRAHSLYEAPKFPHSSGVKILKHTAIPYRTSTGFSLCSPVRKTTQGKPCFHYREWVCSALVTAKLRTFVLVWYDPGKNELCVCTLMTDWICETELRSRPKLGKKSQKSVLSRVECRNEGSDSIGGDYFLHAKSNWNKRRTIALIA